MSTVLSIQSSVAYGHAGNSAAVFPMQRAGIDVIAVYTVHFSNHTGYQSWRGPLLAPDDVRAVVTGVEERDALPAVDALLCGYLGAPEMGEVILEAGEKVKSHNPNAVFCADPVMGDVDRGFYARPGIPEFWRDRVVEKADIMSPNLFELEFLTGRQTKTLADVVSAAQSLRAAGPDVVLVTSTTADDLPADELHMLAVRRDEVFIVSTPKLDRTFTGSGDLTTATFLTHWLRAKNLAEALGRTASVVYSILEATTAQGARELRLVSAQEDIVEPRFTFEARKLEI
ncbi:pyridoxal kinase PdxY [Tessaracoccus sp. OH4464_COT-324]|uniref:pyridoxal kinase PdxY n=1 Tax=Tessaracoccus sp. OH4464_COT-324 TaxID=2491059 RepID=UPI000F63F371|nr:pyridoxal kinase PdxY [Tessaracoccus sp. OH4464_COT-324]RRD48008.1 pyridoxal kinase PdxY [Tessaracoccus sp. OH4464_COT-324]